MIIIFIQGFYALIYGIVLGYIYNSCNYLIYPILMHIYIKSSSLLISMFAPVDYLDKRASEIAIVCTAIFIAMV